ncbi:hypothetical protein [Nocardia seriolae]|uniref:hypothetical protein n=1 Tax=Nocardia seriolae TaxID=37332 RepID=UPI00090AB518|nr:hypothetical protein [Nocardia seriolae]BAW10128.1 conserved hypothetical protein [Nocardia seriolae]
MRIIARVAAAAVLGAALLSTATAQAAPAGTTIEPPIDCTPTTAHPNPIVVLPGGDGTPEQTDEQWTPVLTVLRGAGYCTVLFQLDFRSHAAA